MRYNWITFFLLVGLLSLIWACNQPINVPPINDPNDLSNFLSDSLGIDSCVVRDTISASALPPNVPSYLNANFPQDSIREVLFYQSTTDSLYQVNLSSGTVVLFDAAGNYLWDGDPSILAPTALDDDLVDSLNLYFPGLDIDEVELEWSYGGVQAYEIELESDIELYVFVSADHICFIVEDDDDDDGPYDCDDDDDDYYPVDSLSATIIQYIDSVYPNATIEGCAEIESFCDSVDTYHIEIEKANGVDVYLAFDFNDMFLHELAEAGLSSLPSAVRSSLSNNYSGFILEDEIHILTQANGDELYQVWIENDDTDEELSVVFDMNGGVICEVDDP